MTDRYSHGDGALLRKAWPAIGLAAAVWPYVFRGKHGNFWARMTLAAGCLGLYGLKVRPEQREELPSLTDGLAGAASAGGLYVIFQIGDRLSRRIMPTGSEDIESIYRLRTLAPRPLIATLLMTVIGPSEELFWRGLVQEGFMRRYGRVRGTLLGAAVYGGVHLGSRNLTLTGAASTAGLYWGSLYAWKPRLGPQLVSHILWDVWIFLIQPTPGAGHDEGQRPPT